MEAAFVAYAYVVGAAFVGGAYVVEVAFGACAYVVAAFADVAWMWTSFACAYAVGEYEISPFLISLHIFYSIHKLLNR